MPRASMGFAMLVSLSFTFELFDVKYRAHICHKGMYSISKGLGDTIHYAKGFVSMHSQLCDSMAMTE
jgi:hypothetical protein